MMDRYWAGVIEAAFILVLINLSECLRCFKCDNTEQRQCGSSNVGQHYHSIECRGHGEVKCGVQIQPPNKDGWVGIVRGCYWLGSLKVDESNGCHSIVLDRAKNYTGRLCLCDTDECNDTSGKDSITTSPCYTYAVVMATAIYLVL